MVSESDLGSLEYARRRKLSIVTQNFSLQLERKMNFLAYTIK